MLYISYTMCRVLVFFLLKEISCLIPFIILEVVALRLIEKTEENVQMKI